MLLLFTIALSGETFTYTNPNPNPSTSNHCCRIEGNYEDYNILKITSYQICCTMDKECRCGCESNKMTGYIQMKNCYCKCI